MVMLWVFLFLIWVRNELLWVFDICVFELIYGVPLINLRLFFLFFYFTEPAFDLLTLRSTQENLAEIAGNLFDLHGQLLEAMELRDPQRRIIRLKSFAKIERAMYGVMHVARTLGKWNEDGTVPECCLQPLSHTPRQSSEPGSSYDNPIDVDAIDITTPLRPTIIPSTPPPPPRKRVLNNPPRVDRGGRNVRRRIIVESDEEGDEEEKEEGEISDDEPSGETLGSTDESSTCGEDDSELHDSFIATDDDSTEETTESEETTYDTECSCPPTPEYVDWSGMEDDDLSSELL
jgi:hypothetical protein